MTDISRVTLPNGSTYNLKDAEARQQIEDLAATHTTAIHYRGVTSTNLVDGSTVNPITIDNKNFTAKSGDIVIVGVTGTNSGAPREYIFNGTKWNEFGSTGSLKGLAFKDSASGSYKPKGTISGSFEGSVQKIESSYTPSGSISTPTFSGKSSEFTVRGNLVNATSTLDYTPRGEISDITFQGTPIDLVIEEKQGDVTYTPRGSVSTPIIQVEKNFGTVNSLSDVGALPTFSMNVDDNQVLNFSFNEGALPSYEQKTLMTNIQSITASQPTFSGVGTRLETHYAPQGVIPKPSFIGENVNLQITVTAPTQTMTGSYTPSGTISTPIFTGNAGIASANYAPGGNITGLTFEGTSEVITVS